MQVKHNNGHSRCIYMALKCIDVVLVAMPPRIPKLFEPTVLGQFRIRFFDGADTWKYIGEGGLGTVPDNDA